jgi:hypothetical protein
MTQSVSGKPGNYKDLINIFILILLPRGEDRSSTREKGMRLTDPTLCAHVTCPSSLSIKTLSIKRSLKLGHVSTSTRPRATALPGSQGSGAL